MAEIQVKITDDPLKGGDEHNLKLSTDRTVCIAEEPAATSKEEEWVTKKKIELTTTRQIETRVKRQVVLEDGKVVDDTGPVVTTHTTEDTEKQEHNQTERRTLGDDDSTVHWTPISHDAELVEKIQEKTVKSREEKEERTETEKVQHLGDISDEGYMAAVKLGCDLRQSLQSPSCNEMVFESLPKIIHQSTKIKKYIDTEDKTKLNRVQPGGKIINETKTTRLREEFNDCDVSDESDSSVADFPEGTTIQNSQRYHKTKEQDLTEFVANGKKIGEKLNFQSEVSEGERYGHGFQDDYDNDDRFSSKLQRIKLGSQTNKAAFENEHLTAFDKNIRPSKVTPVLDEEAETRKEETFKWLEHHFGSDSTKSSKGSASDLDDAVISTPNSFINVTMKSQLNKPSCQSSFIEIPKYGENQKKVLVSPTSEYFTEDNGRTDKREESSRVEVYAIKAPASRFSLHESKLSDEKFEKRFSATGTEIEKDKQGFRDGSDSDPVGSGYRPRRILPDGVRNLRHSSFSTNNDDQSDRNGPEIMSLSSRRDACLTSTPGENIEIKMSNSNSDLLEPARKIEPTGASFETSKKHYQRTRFAADLPSPPIEKASSAKVKSKFGDVFGFRKLIDKLKTTSSERKNKKRLRSVNSRSPSPRENTYQNYNSLDIYGSLVNKSDDVDGNDDDQDIESPVPPPRTKHHQVQVRLRSEDPEAKSLQRYYLGEDPFSGLTYGKEKQYKDPSQTRARSGEDTDFKSRTMGRLTKSNGRTPMSEYYSQNNLQWRGNNETLPQKAMKEKPKYADSKDKRSLGESYSFASDDFKPVVRTSNSSSIQQRPISHAHSLINVSFINRCNYQTPNPTEATTPYKDNNVSWLGPVKPARTYQAFLPRSQSFSAQPRQRSSIHVAEGSQPPLESPTIICNWNRNRNFFNTNDYCKERLSGKSYAEQPIAKLNMRPPEAHKTFDYDKFDRQNNNCNDRIKSEGAIRNRESNLVDSNKTLNDYPQVFTHTFCDGNVTRTVSRTESLGKDDYSETVRIKSKSDDPMNFSQTDTVKTFSKKKIPSKAGTGFETIESSETKTVVKSQGIRNGFY